MRLQLTKFTRSVMIGLVFLCILGQLTMGQTKHTATPKEGFVPNEETAIKIAEAVLVPIYGIEEIKQEQPLVAKLKRGVWVVSGTIHPDSSGAITKGGTAVIEISKADGRILRVSHGK